MQMVARIVPKDPRRGFKCERYVYRGFRFEASRGWYQVSNELAEELRKCVQDPNAPVFVPIFQVASEADAGKIEREDWEREHPERKITEAIKGAQIVPERRLVPLPKPEREMEDGSGIEDRSNPASDAPDKEINFS